MSLLDNACIPTQLLGHSSSPHVVSAGPGDFTAAAATAATAARAGLHTARVSRQNRLTNHVFITYIT